MLTKYLDSKVRASNVPAKRDVSGSKLNVAVAAIAERTYQIIPSYAPQRNRLNQERMETVLQRTGLP